MARRRSPPRFFHHRGGRMFEGVKVSREIHPAKKFSFSLCFSTILFPRARVYRRCWEFFFFLRFWDASFFLWFNFFKWYTRGEEVTNEISYLLEMKSRIFWLSLKVWQRKFWKSIFFESLFFFFWICYVTYKGKLLEEENSRVKFILSFRKWNVFNVFWWKGLIIRLCEIYHILPFTLQLDKNDYICKMDGKIRIYIRLYRFFEFFILYQLIFYLTITIQFLSMIK